MVAVLSYFLLSIVSPVLFCKSAIEENSSKLIEDPCLSTVTLCLLAPLIMLRVAMTESTYSLLSILLVWPLYSPGVLWCTCLHSVETTISRKDVSGLKSSSFQHVPSANKLRAFSSKIQVFYNRGFIPVDSPKLVSYVAKSLISSTLSDLA